MCDYDFDMTTKDSVDEAFPVTVVRRVQQRQKLPEDVDHTVNITVNQRGDWTVAIPQEAEKVSKNQAPASEEGVVALDPGVRCFQTRLLEIAFA